MALGAQSLYLVAFTVLAAGWIRSMSALDGVTSLARPVTITVVGMVAVLVLAVTAVAVWQAARTPRQPGAVTRSLLGGSAAVNLALLASGLMHGVWILNAALLGVIALLVLQMIPAPRTARTVAVSDLQP